MRIVFVFFLVRWFNLGVIGQDGNPEYHEKARQAVRESIVMMRNRNNLLPLDDTTSIFLAGSTANLKQSLTGGWTYLWGNQDDLAFPDEMLTIKEALFSRLGEERVTLANADNFRELFLYVLLTVFYRNSIY